MAVTPPINTRPDREGGSMTPDETAEKVLEGVIRSSMKFSDFRWKMIEAHPEYLSDDAIHGLYMTHVMGWEPVTVTTIPLADPSPEGFDGSLTCICDPNAHSHMDCPVHNPWSQVRFSEPEKNINEARARLAEGEIEKPDETLKAINQVVEWADKNRATPQDVLDVAKKHDRQARYSGQSRRKRKKNKFKRALGNIKFRA